MWEFIYQMVNYNFLSVDPSLLNTCGNRNFGLMLMCYTYRLRIAQRLSLANSLIDRMPNAKC